MFEMGFTAPGQDCPLVAILNISFVNHICKNKLKKSLLLDLTSILSMQSFKATA